MLIHELRSRSGILSGILLFTLALLLQTQNVNAVSKWPKKLSGSLTFSETYLDRSSSDYSDSLELNVTISHLTLKLVAASRLLVVYRVIDGAFIATGWQVQDSYYTSSDDRFCSVKKTSQFEGVGGVGNTRSHLINTFMRWLLGRPGKAASTADRVGRPLERGFGGVRWGPRQNLARLINAKDGIYEIACGEYSGLVSLYPARKRWEILVPTNPAFGAKTTTIADSCRGNSEPAREPASFAVTLHGRGLKRSGRKVVIKLKTKYDYIAYQGAAPVSYEGQGQLSGVAR